ncbi:thioredoxin family protein [Candidatus Thioglobus autotrophicus]|uniref:thioredoxin family protein n=1 Tax=Candidatus Thioglobus autotrophicus TaxID=1705394 RepID=UPI00299DEB4E|nr:thioredoxin fold domain-containing protein [Candidatus Thioglobus autotrophicus]WPE17870.1 thioredoxin fold domain-containing protein [Candidatus Thioglobus autotrophicus]
MVLMRRIFILVIAFFCINTYADSGKVIGGSLYDVPSWFTDSFLDVAEDAQDALDENKTVLLYFHLDGCPYCDAMLTQNFKSGENLAFIKKHFSVVAVNIKGARDITMSESESKTEQALSEILAVKYTPTIIFLDEDGKQAFRTNGYRDVAAFRQVLEYVASKSYKNTTLSNYIEAKQNTSQAYTFINHASLQVASNFQEFDQPVAILFEDKDCTACEDFHQNLINRADVKAELDKYLFVRFDAYSDQKIIGFDGKLTSPRQMVKDYDLNYRPGILLFDEGENITKIDGKLYSFHFNTVLRYVSGKHYQYYPKFSTYLRARQAELLEKGININIVD